MEPIRSILLAEEDATIRAFLADNLTADGYAVLPADTKRAAIGVLEAHQPDLVLCDVNGDTLALLDAVRAADGLASRIHPDTPLIVLTARGDELARLRYFDRGSDDVVAKPFSYPELRARIRALLRRTHGHGAGRVMRVGTLHIDTLARDVRIGETPIELSTKEYALLCHLAADPTRVFTKNELLRDVWGYRSRGMTRTLDSHACRLRHKLVAADGWRWIENVWGVGYRLAPVDPRAADASAA
jgi:DNA-binding response OmpR family regulator